MHMYQYDSNNYSNIDDSNISNSIRRRWMTVSIIRPGPLSWRESLIPVQAILGGVQMICCCGDT